MQSTLSLLSIAMLLAVAGQTALAQTIASPQLICSSRLTGLEKAKCLVDQRNEILRQLGRLPPAPAPRSPAPSEKVQGEVGSDSSVSSPTPVTTAQTSSPTQPRSCSRLRDKEKALCLVEQRKELLRQLEMAPRLPLASIVTVPRPNPVVKKANCTRYRGAAERAACHAGNRDGMATSASASSN